MLFVKTFKRRKASREVASPERVRLVGSMTVYADTADPNDVATRIRNMTYGSTSTRIAVRLDEEAEDSPAA